MQKYDIHGKGVPKLVDAELLKKHLKSMATKEMYEMSKKIRRTGKPNPDAPHAINTSNAEIPKGHRFEMIPLLEKCFPNLTFFMAGYFIYGPGDAIDEHTNNNTIISCLECNLQRRRKNSDKFLFTKRLETNQLKINKLNI